MIESNSGQKRLSFNAVVWMEQMEP